jgi:hypothetical protein
MTNLAACTSSNVGSLIPTEDSVLAENLAEPLAICFCMQICDYVRYDAFGTLSRKSTLSKPFSPRKSCRIMQCLQAL